ncbi:MAG: TraY domain-containing protein [Rhizobiales bacterium]|nr:TraY domain-containing protein [Hyphomicrobiales bacterium]
MLALRLPPDVEKRLDNLARKTGRTKSFYAREAILEHIDDLEDLYFAEQRMRDDPEFVSLEEVTAKYGIDPTKPDEK